MKLRFLMPMLFFVLFACKSKETTRKEDAVDNYIKKEVEDLTDKNREAIIVIPEPVVEPTPVISDFIGKHDVLLTTNETDCFGKSSGDARPETWNISLANQQLKMNVISDERTIKEYTEYSFNSENGVLTFKGKKENLLGVEGKATIGLEIKNGKIFGTRKVSTNDEKGDPCSIEQTIKEQ